LVEVVQKWHLVAIEHPSDSGAGNVQVVADAVRTPPAGDTQRHDSSF